MNDMRGENTLIIVDCNREIHEVDVNAFNRNFEGETKKLISFGRGSECDIVLSSQIVSQVHGFFEFVEGNLYVYDNNSTNGLFVNGRFYKTREDGSCELHKLRDGDIIRIDSENDEGVYNGEGEKPEEIGSPEYSKELRLTNDTQRKYQKNE